MIKGVNKQIIEINDIDNEHFYKAILFVRPESSPRSHEYLNKRADEYIELTADDITDNPQGFLRTSVNKKRTALVITAISSSAVLTGIGILLFFL